MISVTIAVSDQPGVGKLVGEERVLHFPATCLAKFEDTHVGDRAGLYGDAEYDESPGHRVHRCHRGLDARAVQLQVDDE